MRILEIVSLYSVAILLKALMVLKNSEVSSSKFFQKKPLSPVHFGNHKTTSLYHQNESNDSLVNFSNWLLAPIGNVRYPDVLTLNFLTHED